MNQEDRKNQNKCFRPAGGRVLQQSVLKHIPRRGDGVMEGAALGFDAAIFQNGEITEMQAVGAQPSSRFPEEYPLTAGEAAWITAENQLAVKGAFGPGGVSSPVGGSSFVAQVLLVAGMSCPENRIRREMQRLAQISARRGCPIVGGNTVYFQEGEDCLVQVVLTGRRTGETQPGVPETELHKSELHGTELYSSDHTISGKAEGRIDRRMQPGDRVYFLGEVGCLGADLLVKRNREQLRTRFADSYIDTMEYTASDFSVKEKAAAALAAGAVFLHDVSNGGVHAALYQLAEAAGCGIRVRHEGLTIRQSVVELCEFLNINPYQLLGTGGLLAVVPAEKSDEFESRMEAHISEVCMSEIRTSEVCMSEMHTSEKYLQETDASPNRERLPIRFHCAFAGELTKEKARLVTAESFHMERYLNLPEGDALEEVL